MQVSILPLVLLAITYCGSAIGQQTESENDRPIKSRVGIVHERPSAGRFVATQDGYMVAFKIKIPGSDVEIEMLPIAGGKFMMGSAADDNESRQDERPQFEVHVEPFWMGKYEVTWAQYKLYMKLDKVFKAFDSKGVRQIDNLEGVDAITAPSSLYDPSFTFEAGAESNQPAATMSQFAAKQYTKWLSLLTGDFYRLPTESEWEYACRAGTATRYYFGNDAEQLENHAWFYDNSEEMRHEVGKLKPNPWGLYDMYGNVAEWVLDKYDEESYEKNKQKPGDRLSVDNAWVKPTSVFPRVLRGGSWELEAEDCRSAARMASNEDWRDEDPNYPQSPWWFTTSPGLGTGFRIIRPLNAPGTMDHKELYWRADVPRIFKDAKNRILDNGRGAFGLVDPDLPQAIKSLTDADR